MKSSNKVWKNISRFHLILILVFTWIAGKIYFDEDSKSKYYVKTDNEFLENLQINHHSSAQARIELFKWLSKLNDYRNFI
jgi:hypothetical protein